jgi:hypothetical protein
VGQDWHYHVELLAGGDDSESLAYPAYPAYPATPSEGGTCTIPPERGSQPSSPYHGPAFASDLQDPQNDDLADPYNASKSVMDDYGPASPS